MNEAEEKRTSAQTEDEVSLVDLLAVMVRYRRLVIAVPLVLAVLAGTWLYLLPAIGVNAAQRAYDVQISAVLSPVPADIKAVLGIDATQLLDAYFSSVAIQSAAFGSFFPEALKGMSPVDMTTFVRDQLLGKQFKYSFDPKLGIYTIAMKSTDKEQADRYLTALWSGASDKVLGRVRDAVATALALLDKEIVGYRAAMKSDSTVSAVLASATNLRNGLLVLQDSQSFPLPTQPEHLVFAAKTGRSKTLVLVLFAGLFLGILLAFMANAWNSIKEDPEAMAKLRAAWKR